MLNFYSILIIIGQVNISKWDFNGVSNKLDDHFNLKFDSAELYMKKPKRLQFCAKELVGMS